MYSVDGRVRRFAYFRVGGNTKSETKDITMKVSLCFSILITFVALSCQTQSGGKGIQNVGEYDKNGLETGIWELKDSTGIITESGRFDSGLMVGIWNYFLPVRDEWEWKAIKSPNGKIKTSLPVFVSVKENYDSLILASSIDTGIGFTAIVSTNASVISSISEYSDAVFSELRASNIKIIDSAKQKIVLKNGQEYVYHHILCLTPRKDTLQLFNMATINDNNKLIEVTVRCEQRLELFGRRTFYSIAPYTFINNKRFINQKDEVGTVVGRREY
jgi:hypothetical protein